jgi:hypothetical protein
MEMVILKDGRRGLFSKELMTIKTLELWEGDLPSITYHLTEQDLEDQVVRTVGGLVNWVYSNS